MLAYNRFVPIEPAPDYSEGLVSMHNDITNPLVDNWVDPLSRLAPSGYLVIYEAVWSGTPGFPGAPNSYINSPTSWYWNIRVGDKFQFKNSGRLYTIIGPMVWGPAQGNPEGFVNIGAPGTPPPADQFGSPFGATSNPEFLYLVNGVDDNNDGFIDNSWDGVDNNLNGLVDYVPNSTQYVDGPLTNPTNPETEPEQWLGDQKNNPVHNSMYVINRRATVSQGTREISLPGGVVIDATAWNTTAERSRLPIDSNTLYVDVMVQPNGQVIPNSLYSNPAAFGLAAAFYHFWLTDREDVHQLVVQNNVPYQLPMPEGTIGYPNTNDTFWKSTFLTGERRLLTLYNRTGNIVTNEIEPAFPSSNPVSGASIFSSGFLGTNPNGGSVVNNPFIDAQVGVREAK